MIIDKAFLAFAMAWHLGGTPVAAQTVHDSALAAIMRRESGGHQFDARGRVLRNPLNSHVVGLFQIDERYHRLTCLRRGADIYTADGNMACAYVLRTLYGLTPWGGFPPIRHHHRKR